MYKRLIALLFSVMLLSGAAVAESTPLYQVYTFAGQLPDRLTEPLSSLIPDESRILSGAAIQHNGNYDEADEPGSWASYSAMLVVDTNEGPLLLAAAWVDGMPWQVNDFSRFLRREENVSVSIYQPEADRIPVFSVDYPGQDGLVSDLMLFRGNRLWQLYGHIDEAAGLQIIVDGAHATIRENGVNTFCNYPEPFWMDYLADGSGFPTTRADVETLDKAAASVFVSNNAAGRGYTVGSHLRSEATSKSESLGIYASDVPLQLTGEEKPGTQLPWYQVLIGDTVGWMTAAYIDYEPARYYPVLMGRTADGCPMYAQAGDAQPCQQLAPGATFHILTEINGLYHICIPQGDISWEPDRDGLYGYIPKEGVLTGYSPTALDALENAR